jgi:putative DNA primase/helicase
LEPAVKTDDDLRAAIEGVWTDPGSPFRHGPMPGAELKPKGNGRAKRPVVDRRDYMMTARRWLRDDFTRDGFTVVKHWRGDFWRWTGTHYSAIPAEEMRGMIWRFLDGCCIRGENGDAIPYKPKAENVGNVLGALAALTGLPSSVDAPAWLDGRKTPAVRLICVSNGVLDMKARKLRPHDPALFTTWALDFPYLADAEPPAEWLKFLASVWPDDQQSIDTLQEIVGYLVSGDTRQQKAFMVVGPRRSGKGTIGRVVQELMGRANKCAPTLASLAGPFGLQQLIGKPLALISDARLSGRADQAVIVENLLRITGEDALSVDRKFKEPWAGQLPTRFLLMSNELPRLTDTSGALAGRFITLVMSVSFYGREDLKLMDRLTPELPAILSWALDGYRRLVERGAFVEPDSSREIAEEMEELGSPVGAFVKDTCVVGPGYKADAFALFNRWQEWCKARGREFTPAIETFARDLRAVAPSIKKTRPRRATGERYTAYEGIGILA